MSLRIRNFGGPVIWLFRKHISNITSGIMLTVTAHRYDKIIQKYMNFFNMGGQTEAPLFVNCMVETINRCNGSCEFCPANVHDEVRPFKKMDEKMFRRIVSDLKNISWSGKLWLSINNEPFIDKRILSFAKYAKEELKDIQIALVTNGTLLNDKKMDEMVGVVDEITINDYSDQYKLSKKHKEIFDYVKKNKSRFSGMNITINRRYSKEILATRAGHAPNKKKKNNKIDTPCIYPFLDILIFPDGKVGMCCNDCLEESNFGDISENSLSEIWNNNKFRNLREAMLTGRRSKYPFCKECDVVDAGERERFIKKKLRKR